MAEERFETTGPSDGGARVLEHEYDGIREFDNPTPGWWHMLFWGSILFSVLYFAFFSGELGWTPYGRLAAAEARHFERMFGDLGDLEADEQTMLELMAEDRWIVVGRSIFSRNCAQCHKASGGGLNGPNLTDDCWKNVKQMADIYDVVTDGLVAKGMPAWSSMLNKNQRIMVSMYVASLRGSNPSDGIGCDGDRIDPWPEPAAESASLPAETPEG
jgi:cytochrome c oxidase cbb3-type subunit 3